MKRVLSIIFLQLFLALLCYSDTREDPIDLILLIDKSKSMDIHLENVKKYIASDVIGKFIQTNDSVSILLFYGKTDLLLSEHVKNEAEKRLVIQKLNTIKPNGSYTDIGNALDELGKILEKDTNPERKKYILLVTDEKQEAPPESKYFKENGSFKHQFLTYTAKKEVQGFFVITVGIGIDEKIASKADILIKTLKEAEDGSLESTNSLIDAENPSTSTNVFFLDFLQLDQFSFTILVISLCLLVLLIILLAFITIRRLQSRKTENKRE